MKKCHLVRLGNHRPINIGLYNMKMILRPKIGEYYCYSSSRSGHDNYYFFHIRQ